MATYTNAYFPGDVQKRYNKRITMLERDFSFTDYPARTFAKGGDGIASGDKDYETGVPYATNDVIELIGLRAGTTVIGVEVELVRFSSVVETQIEVGIGSDTDLFGLYDLYNNKATARKLYPVDDRDSYKNTDDLILGRPFKPVYFPTADTIDIKLVRGVHGNPGRAADLGSDLITTGNMASTTGWTGSGAGGWAIAAGVATHTAGTAGNLTNTGALAAGRYYYTTFDLVTTTATNGLTVRGSSKIWGTVAGGGPGKSSLKAQAIIRNATATTWRIGTHTSGNGWAGTVDNVTMKLLRQADPKIKLRVYVLEDAVRYNKKY
jgi:hypothetical protein